MLSSGGMTKRLDRLADAGPVRRRPDPADRRGTLVGLTRPGKAIIDKAVATHVANEDRLLRSLSAADRRALDRLLRTMLADLEPRAPGHDPDAPGNRPRRRPHRGGPRGNPDLDAY